MEKLEERFAPFSQRMIAEGLPQIFIDTFKDYYSQLVSGATGSIPEDSILPVDQIPDMESLGEEFASIGKEALKKTAVVKLNGGLGTSMGLEKAKSLLQVKNDYSFLDIIARQLLDAGVPLILMNSFATEEDSIQAIMEYSQLSRGLPSSFLQHKELKVTQEGYLPVDWPANPELEWCPPGHGDIYTALVTRQILSKLLDHGYRYAFVSNADNLGAILDTVLLGYFVGNQFPFLMEVADRTPVDRKGGHLARRKNDGNFILRESAQCPEVDIPFFQDINRHRFFNTNNLWINLEMLHQVMENNAYKLGLPMIRNAKNVDPRDSGSIPVYQIETAMGSAIGVFDGAQAVRVPRSRFAPVKKTDDLLAVRSDAYDLTDDFRIVLDSGRKNIPPDIKLDERFFKFIFDLDARFPDGPPSLKHCSQFIVEGDVLFEKGVRCQGRVKIINDSAEQLVIKEGTTLQG